MLSLRYRLVVLSRSRGDGIVKALGNAGFDNFSILLCREKNGSAILPEPLVWNLLWRNIRRSLKSSGVMWGRRLREKRQSNVDFCFYAFGDPPLEELEDLMDILL